MEVLFVSHKHPPAIGGMEKQSFELVNGMRKFVTVHTIVFEGQESRLNFFLRVGNRIKTTLRKNPRIKIIHYNDGLMAAWCSRYGDFGSVKQAVTLHGLDLVFPHPFYQKRIVPRFNKLDLLIAVSQATAQAAKERGLLPTKIYTIPNGVEIKDVVDEVQNMDNLLKDKFTTIFKHKNILVAYGRPVKRKGFSWFIKEVMPLLGKDTVLVLAGPITEKESLASKAMRKLPASFYAQMELFLGLPSDEQELKTLINSPHNYSKVIHVGLLPSPILTKLLKSSTAFIMPNIYIPGDMEGFGLVCLEACLAETTVFAADIQGITEAIHHGKNGYLIPSGDAKAWAKSLKEFFDKGKVGGVQLQNAKEYTIDQFSWNKMAYQYYNAFKSL